MNAEVTEYLENQIKKQYKNTKESTSKLNLNVEQFCDDLDLMENEKYEYLNKMLKNGTIKEIHYLYNNTDINPKEIVIYYLKRIKENQNLNTIISLNPDIIKQSLELTNIDSNKPLYGIPIILKDNIATKDRMPTTGGASALKDSFVEKDAFIVDKLRKAGAIILGKANLSEWANFMTNDFCNGYSASGGQTKNPFGMFDVGGSSSGSAVSVASYLCPIALGTETSGSLIYPANQNNVVALKPTVGLVSRDLIIPLSENQDTAGPIANTVSDIARILEVISSEDNNDLKTKNSIKKDYLKYIGESIKNLKAGFLNDRYVKNEYRENDEEILNEAKGIFKNEGMIIKDIEFKKDVYEINLFDLLTFEFKRDLNEYLLNPYVKSDLNIKKIVEYNKKDKENYMPYGQDIIEKSSNNDISVSQYNDLLKTNTLISREALDNAFKDVDVVISLSNYASRIYACAGYPAISIPAGFRKNGEPIGITIIANKYEEDKLIQIGYRYEQKTHRRKLLNYM